MNIIWSPEALADVEAALDYLVEESPPAAEKLAAGIPTDCYQGVVGLALEGQRKKRWSVERLAVEDTDGWVRSACSSWRPEAAATAAAIAVGDLRELRELAPPVLDVGVSVPTVTR